MSALKPALAVAGLLLLTGATRDSDEKALARELKGRVPEAPVSCIDAHDAEGPVIINKRTLIYRNLGRVYRNDLPAECRSLTDTSTIIIDLYGGEICEHDRFRTREPGEIIPSQFCFLGKFTPYSKPRR